MRIIRLMIYFILIAHWVACIWWLVGSGQENLEQAVGVAWIFRGGSSAACVRPDNTPSDYAQSAALIASLPATHPSFNNSGVLSNLQVHAVM